MSRLQKHELTVIFWPPSAEIPLYHILNARITFSNLNGCEEGTGNRNNNEAGLEVDGQKDTPRTDTPSPSSDSSSVSSSSSSSTSKHTPHTFLTSSSVDEAAADVNWRTCDVLYLPKWCRTELLRIFMTPVIGKVVFFVLWARLWLT